LWVGSIGGDGSAASAGGDEDGLTALQDRSSTDTRHKFFPTIQRGDPRPSPSNPSDP